MSDWLLTLLVLLQLFNGAPSALLRAAVNNVALPPPHAQRASPPAGSNALSYASVA